MQSTPILLRPLTVADEASFKNAVAEFARETPPWQFAFGFEESLPFSEYVKTLEGHSRGIGVPAGFVPNTYFVGVVDNVVVGRLSLRHTLNEFLARIGGHIGYGVIPSQRNRGYATAMLRQAIPICASLGIQRALITCDEDNVASRKVIEACGGVFESIIDCPDSGVPKRRHWLATSPNPDGVGPLNEDKSEEGRIAIGGFLHKERPDPLRSTLPQRSGNRPGGAEDLRF